MKIFTMSIVFVPNFAKWAKPNGEVGFPMRFDNIQIQANFYKKMLDKMFWISILATKGRKLYGKQKSNNLATDQGFNAG